jgi:hypothetical protein
MARELMSESGDSFGGYLLSVIRDEGRGKELISCQLNILF